MPTKHRVSEKKKPKKKKGWFKRTFGKKSDSDDDDEDKYKVSEVKGKMKRDGGIKNEQSLVTSYNVEAEMHEIAMECYQSAFKKAGVKKKDLEDPVTRKLIFDMINNQDAYKPNQEGAKLIAERKERKR